MTADFTGKTAPVTGPAGWTPPMQAWIRRQDPGRIGTAAHERFNQNFAERTLIAHLSADDTGAIRDVSTAPVGS